MALNESEQEAGTGLAEDTAVQLPPDYKVVLYNDDYTTKEFVVEILETVFHKSSADAVVLMEKVHHSGKAVVGTYTYDIAATRASITVKRARDAGFPLRCELEL